MGEGFTDAARESTGVKSAFSAKTYDLEPQPLEAVAKPRQRGPCVADNLSLFCLSLRRRSLTSFSQIALAPLKA
jgi:hypothetical protein